MTDLRHRVERLEHAATSSVQSGATANDLANFPGMRNLVAGSGASLTPSAGTLTVAATGGGSVPTGTGFTHITAGVQDAAAKTVDLASSDVTGDLPYANLVQATAASRILVRGSAGGAGDWQEGTLGTNLSFAGTVLNASGGQVDTIVAGDGIDVDSTDPVNPEVSAKISADAQNQAAFGSDGGIYVPLFGTSASMIGGTGEDGDCDLDGTNTFGWCSKSGNVYTLTRTPFIARLRITTGCELRTASRPIWAQEWDVTTGFYGIITSNGTSGASIVAPAGGGGNGGAAATANGQYYPFGAAAAGTNGSAGVFTGNSTASSNVANISASIGGQGSRGGQGGAGSTGTPGTPGTMGTFAQFQSTGVSPFAPLGGAFGLTTASTSGGPGTGGTGGTGTGGGTAGGGGGGAGSGGAGIDLMVGEIVTDATTPAALVRARGGNGGNGSDYTFNTTGDKGGGGGGGAGGGGGIRIVCGLLTGPAVTGFADASGGNGGNGGTGVNAGNPGNGAAGGNGGQIRIYNLTAGTVSVTNGSNGSAAAGATGGAGGACISDLA